MQETSEIGLVQGEVASGNLAEHAPPAFVFETDASSKDRTQQPFVDGTEKHQKPPMEGTTSVATKYLLDKVFVIDVVFDNGNANHDRPCVDGVRGGHHHISSLLSTPPPVKGHESICICDDENGNRDSLYT